MPAKNPSFPHMVCGKGWFFARCACGKLGFFARITFESGAPQTLLGCCYRSNQRRAPGTLKTHSISPVQACVSLLLCYASATLLFSNHAAAGDGGGDGRGRTYSSSYKRH